MHVREGGFKNDWNNPLNVNIQNCIDSIREITSRGGHVVRLGDATMQKLPKIEGLIDYHLPNLKIQRWISIY